MKANFDVKSIEEIALEYLRFQNHRIIKMGFSTDTTVDTGTYEKDCLIKNKEYLTQISRTFNTKNMNCTRGKLLSKNDKQEIYFYKVPPKDLGEEEDCTYSYSGFISPINLSRISTSKLVEKFSSVELRPIIKIKNNNNKIYFPFNYANVYDGITELYHPLLNNLDTIDSIKSLLSNSIMNINNFFTHASIFEPCKNVNVNVAKFLEEHKIFELIEFNQLLMFFQIIDDESSDCYLCEFDDEKIFTIYQNCIIVLQKLYTNLMLILLFNIYNNKQNLSNVNSNILSCLNNNNKNNMKNFNNYSTNKQLSFESICFTYVQSFFKNTSRLTLEQIITTFNDNLEEILRCLFITNEIYLIVFKNLDTKKYFNEKSSAFKDKKNTEINNNKNNIINNNLNQVSKENEKSNLNNIDEYKIRLLHFQKISEYLKEKDSLTSNSINTQKSNISSLKNTINTKSGSNSRSKTLKKSKNKTNLVPGNIQHINSHININNNSFYNNENYKKIQNISKGFLSTFRELINRNTVPIPFLPPLNKKLYTYTLVLDLDETLVHYVEDEERPFVQVRPYATYFLSEMGKFFEIVIFTAAAEDYADLVLDELDKKKAISYRLYRRHTKPNRGAFLKDLSKLGREISKICIVDNNRDNFGLQPQNGLHISTFMGDQNDTELLLLCNDLMRIVRSNKKDIRPIIKEINEAMNKRYSGNKNLINS